MQVIKKKDGICANKDHQNQLGIVSCFIEPLVRCHVTMVLIQNRVRDLVTPKGLTRPDSRNRIQNRASEKNMLIGEYTHTQDDKKRISLPSKFRKEMGKKVVVTRGLDNCLFMYTVKEWMKISEKLGGLSIGQSDSRGFNRIMLAGAQEIDIDSIGRILLPEFQREYAGIESKNKVVFAGVHSRVEIWDETRWKEYTSKILKQADQLAEKLGEIGAI